MHVHPQRKSGALTRRRPLFIQEGKAVAFMTGSSGATLLLMALCASFAVLGRGQVGLAPSRPQERSLQQLQVALSFASR